jgi:hypothetical protein
VGLFYVSVYLAPQCLHNLFKGLHVKGANQGTLEEFLAGATSPNIFICSSFAGGLHGVFCTSLL